MVPDRRGKFGQGRRKTVDGIAGPVRIRDMPLDPENTQFAAQRSAAAYTNHVAELLETRRLTDQAPVDFFAPGLQYLDHLDDAIGRRAFLITGQEHRDRAPVTRMCGHETLQRGHHRRNAALHVGGAAPVQDTLANLRLERR